jgi:protein TonB
MSTALVPSAIRHTLVISAIELPPFMTYLEVPEPTLVVKPDAFRAGEYEREVQQKPDIFIPTFDDRLRLPVMGSVVHPGSTGAVQSLIDGCYPAASRRLSEEGRVVARVVIGADGRALSWAVDQGSGFPRLDAAMDCVLRRLEFVAGRRDGRAVEAMARLPIVFRLH